MLNLGKLTPITLIIQLNIDGSSQSNCLDINVAFKQIDTDYFNDTIIHRRFIRISPTLS